VHRGGNRGVVKISLPEGAGPYTVTAVADGLAKSKSERVKGFTAKDVVHLRIYAEGATRRPASRDAHGAPRRPAPLDGNAWEILEIRDGAGGARAAHRARQRLRRPLRGLAGGAGRPARVGRRGPVGDDDLSAAGQRFAGTVRAERNSERERAAKSKTSIFLVRLLDFGPAALRSR